MTISQAVSTGLRLATSSGRMILLLYAINVLFALVVVLAFRSMLLASVGNTMAIDALVRDFDYTVFSDFWHHFGGRINPLLTHVVWLALLYMLFGVFLGGGILATLRERDKPLSLGEFFRNCGNYFARFFRIFLFFAVVTTLVAVVWGLILSALFSTLTEDAVTERAYVVWGLALFALFCVPILILVLIADYARIDTVVNGRLQMRKAFWDSTKFVFRYLPKTFGLQLLILVIVGLIIAAYWFIEAQIGMTSGLTILIMFVVQQATVGAKVWTRVVTFASELELYSGVSKPESVPAPEPEIPLPLLPEPEPVSKPIAQKKRPIVRRQRKTSKAQPRTRKKRT